LVEIGTSWHFVMLAWAAAGLAGVEQPTGLVAHQVGGLYLHIRVCQRFGLVDPVFEVSQRGATEGSKMAVSSHGTE
jgi:hypothetical protein